MGVLSNLAGSLLGNSKKAVLIIQSEESSTGGLGIASLAQSALSMAGSGFAGLASELSSRASVLEVQYNPSSISILTRADGIPLQTLQNGSDINGLIFQQTTTAENILTVELIFEAINNKDAFMLEKTRLSIGDLASTATGIFQTLVNGGYSVKPQINAFIGMVMRKETRQVAFQWAEMSFHGEVVGAQANYTMFNVSGNPIMGTVRLSIRQQAESSSESQYWTKAFEKCFGK